MHRARVVGLCAAVLFAGCSAAVVVLADTGTWDPALLALLALLIVGASAVRLGVGRLPRAGRPWGGLPGIARPRLTIRSRLNPLLRAAGRLRLVERLRAP